jgi:hypothetical protein
MTDARSSGNDFILTFAVLALSIMARILSASAKQK